MLWLDKLLESASTFSVFFFLLAVLKELIPRQVR